MLNLSSKRVFRVKTLTFMLLFSFSCICELYIKCRIVYKTNKPILGLGMQYQHNAHLSRSISMSTHDQTICEL